ncbi:MAG TPA: TonB-dependent receptor [Gemmatimonadaceae bacterium]|nr:TonB-dependent receptor [Gemmatimonadaceae bacterium]
MKKLWSVLSLVLLPAALQAQVTISGKVVDQQSGAAVVGATVHVPGTALGANTGADGTFTFTSPTAVARINVSRTGYVAKDVAVNGGDSLVIELTPSATALPGVQVVANKPEPSTAVLTHPDLERGNGINLETSINAVPGLFMQSRTDFGGARITIRGYYPSTSGNSPNANGLGYQVFLNDLPVTDATGTTVLDDIDYATLGNVEVIKGPASSQWGSYIGGAVRFTTERPTIGQTSLSQQVLSGTDGLLRSNTSFQTANDRSDLTVNYGHQAYNSFRPHSASLKDYWRANGDFQVGDDQTVGTYFAYSRSFEELAGEIDSTPFYNRVPQSNAAYLANDSHIALTSVLTGASDHVRINDQFSNETSVFGSGRTSGQPFAHGFTDVNQFNVGFRSVFDFAAQLDNGVGITGALGATMQHSMLTQNGVFIIPAPPYPERPTDQENWATTASIFSEWNFAMPGRVTLTVGGSLNKNDFAIHNLLRNNQLFDTTLTQVRSFDWQFTPRVSVSKAVGRAGSVYASVSSGYTPPLLSNTVASDGTVDLSLKPERAVQYEVGTQGSFLENRLSASVALFDIENADKLVTETSNSVTFTTNAGKQRNQGAEVSLSLAAIDDKSQPLSSLRPWLSYSYTKATFVDFKSDNNDNANTVDFSGNDVPRVPRNMVSAGVDGATNNGFSFNTTYQYVSRVPVTFDNSTYVKGYGLLGARVGYEKQVDRHWKLNAYAGGTNLTSATSYAFIFVGPNYAGLATPASGGHGDGYIIPAPYNANYYGNLTLTYVF